MPAEEIHFMPASAQKPKASGNRISSHKHLSDPVRRGEGKKMKCKLQGDSTAVRYDCSCDNTYDSQYVSDWHSKTPVLIDDLGRTRFLLSSSLGPWEPSHGTGLCAAWLGREEKQFFKS